MCSNNQSTIAELDVGVGPHSQTPNRANSLFEMSRHTASSMKSHSGTSSCDDSTFSRISRNSYDTDNTYYSDVPTHTKQETKAPVFTQVLVPEPCDYRDEVHPRASVETYASTVASREDISEFRRFEFPRNRPQCFAPDSIPATPAEFGKLFPSTRRLMVQHDDSTYDGNMNLRVDTEVTTTSGKQKKLTLFHLRMRDLAERQFSLRRYCRDSGREVTTTKRKYVKPLPVQESKASPTKKSTPSQSPLQRRDSGYEADDDEDDDEELEAALRRFTSQSHIKATIPTDSIRLEFSNYAQVIIEPSRSSTGTEYGFEYWGEVYSWKRRMARDEGEIIYKYDLMNTKTSTRIATLVPDALSAQEVNFEAAQGAWIPASSMRILSTEISADLGDVIVATGLISLTDDCLRRQCQQD